MYYENNKQFGFWITRSSWSNIIAKVISIAGVHEGEAISGEKPYYKNQKVTICIYNKPSKYNNYKGSLQETLVIKTGGNYSYSIIDNKQ